MTGWLVLRGGDELRWGGDLRRRYLFDALAVRTHGRVVDGWDNSSIRCELLAIRGRRWQVWRRPGRVASTELLADGRLRLIRALGIPEVVDLHDQPLLQNRALGIETPPEVEQSLRATVESNLEAFRWHVVQSRSFMRLAGLEPGRTVVAANGCDTSHVRVEPVPPEPVVAMVSGAAPGRGIETLIEACRLARSEVPILRLKLWLVATGDASSAYLDGLTVAAQADPWLDVATAPYPQLSAALGSATIQVVPNPANSYWDAVLPIKLFDAMASGRPVVVTPREETAAVVGRWDAGLVAAGDRPEDMADAIVRLASDDALAARLGGNARRAAETEFDWRLIGARLADELLRRRRRWRWRR